MDGLHLEVQALKRRMRMQTLVSAGVLAVALCAMGGADAVATSVAAAFVETDAWTIRTNNASASLTTRLAVTQGVDTARIKVSAANIELAPQSPLPTGAVAGSIGFDSGTSTFKYYNGTAWVEPGGAGVVRAIVSKPSDESVASSTTLQNDDHLTWAVGANEAWVADFYLHLGATSATPDIQYAIAVPAGATVRYWVVASGTGTNPTSNVGCTVADAAGSAVLAGLGNNQTQGNIIHVAVTTAATGGSVALQWAQRAANASAVTVKAGSRLEATKVN